MDHRRSFITALFVATLLAAAMVLPGCGSSGEAEQPPSTIPDGTPSATGALTQAPTPSASEALPETPSSSPTGSLTVLSVYFMRGQYVGAAHRAVPATPAPAGAAMRQLLAGPTAAEQAAGLHSQIPPGTTVRGLTIRNGVATIDLSGEFAAGGAATEERGRLAQVVYTLTQFPTVKGVRFRIEGEPAVFRSGEGSVDKRAADPGLLRGRHPGDLRGTPGGRRSGRQPAHRHRHGQHVRGAVLRARPRPGRKEPGEQERDGDVGLGHTRHLQRGRHLQDAVAQRHARGLRVRRPPTDAASTLSGSRCSSLKGASSRRPLVRTAGRVRRGQPAGSGFPCEHLVDPADAGDGRGEATGGDRKDGDLPYFVRVAPAVSALRTLERTAPRPRSRWRGRALRVAPCARRAGPTRRRPHRACPVRRRRRETRRGTSGTHPADDPGVMAILPVRDTPWSWPSHFTTGPVANAEVSPGRAASPTPAR